jgi:hypothetical protein
MRPHPRIRKTIKWGGAAVTVLLVGVWIGSGWGFRAWHPCRGWLVSLGHGEIVIFNLAPRGEDLATKYPIDSAWEPFRLALWFDSFGPTGMFAGQLNVPIWAFVIPPSLATGLAWRLDTLARRRAKLNLCPHCHYDRASLAARAVCPECGKLPA